MFTSVAVPLLGFCTSALLCVSVFQCIPVCYFATKCDGARVSCGFLHASVIPVSLQPLVLSLNQLDCQFHSWSGHQFTIVHSNHECVQCTPVSYRSQQASFSKTRCPVRLSNPVDSTSTHPVTSFVSTTGLCCSRSELLAPSESHPGPSVLLWPPRCTCCLFHTFAGTIKGWCGFVNRCSIYFQLQIQNFLTDHTKVAYVIFLLFGEVLE